MSKPKMTLEQYKRELQHFNYIISENQQNAKWLTDDYIAQSPWKKGDKVLVKYKDSGKWCLRHYFIEEVMVGVKPDRPYLYRFAKVKRDGTKGALINIHWVEIHKGIY